MTDLTARIAEARKEINAWRGLIVWNARQVRICDEALAIIDRHTERYVFGGESFCAGDHADATRQCPDLLGQLDVWAPEVADRG